MKITYKLRQMNRWQILQALIGTALLLDTLVLLSFSNFNIGVVLPACFGGGLLAECFGRAHIAQWRARHRGFRLLWRLMCIGLAAWLASFILFVAALALNPPPAPSGKPDFILILGSGLRGDKPSRMLQTRLDAAYTLAQAYPDVPIIASGGQGNQEISSEAQAMRNDLVSRGIATSRILQDSQSRDTFENFAYSRRLIEARGLQPEALNITIVTNDFHALRAWQLAQHTGLTHSTVVCAPTPYSIILNAWLREYLSWIKALLLRQI